MDSSNICCSLCGYRDSSYASCDDCGEKNLCIKCASSETSLCQKCLCNRFSNTAEAKVMPKIKMVGFPKMSYTCGKCGEQVAMFGDENSLCSVPGCPLMFTCPTCKGGKCFKHS